MKSMRSRFSTAAALLAALAACGGGAAGAGPSAGPTPEPGAPAASAASADSIAAALRRATLPASPRQAQFRWELDESGAGFSGRGVARYDAPERFRLDLFGPRGETVLAAALVDGQTRIPPAVAQRFRLPSSGLLWAAVGAVVPPEGARLVSATDQGGRVHLRYDLDDQGTLEYRAQGGRLEQVRRLKSGGIQESVDLAYDAGGALRTARYRDWGAYRNLNLTLESSTDVAAFPDDTWTPPGT